MAASTAQPLALPATGGAPPPSVRIEPAVLLSIADAHGRRPADGGADRVIGTLLGGFAPDGAVDVRDCFTVPHSETAEQVAVDISHHANLLALHRRVTTRDAVVGWFATSPQGAPPSGGDALIHDFYSRECGPSHLPVHVTIDTSLTGSSVRICAYSGRSLSLGNAAPAAAAASTSAAAPAAAEPASPGEAGAAAAASAAAPPSPSPSAAPRPSPKTLATAFVEIPFKVITADAERLGARLLTTELVSPAAPRAAAPAAGGGAEAAATASLDASLERLVSMLESGSRWCSRVAAGEAAPDPAAAAGLADALAALAPLPAPEVEQLVAGATQDAMLLLYLSKLVSAHVTLSDRLGTASLPIL